MGVETQEAVKRLEKRGLLVKGLTGPQGWRFQISLKSGEAYQISEAELLKLSHENSLNWQSVVEIASKGGV
jgi:hypothetical protein